MFAARGVGGPATLAGSLELFADEIAGAQLDHGDYLDDTELETMSIDWVWLTSSEHRYQPEIRAVEERTG